MCGYYVPAAWPTAQNIYLNIRLNQPAAHTNFVDHFVDRAALWNLYANQPINQPSNQPAPAVQRPCPAEPVRATA
jgi:hypothetical protein